MQSYEFVRLPLWALAAAPIDSMETAVSVCVYTQHTTLPQRLVRLVFGPLRSYRLSDSVVCQCFRPVDTSTRLGYATSAV